MANQECGVCGWIYDESMEGEAWKDVAADWECPVCGAEPADFHPIGGETPVGEAAPAPQAAAAGEYLVGYDSAERGRQGQYPHRHWPEGAASPGDGDAPLCVAHVVRRPVARDQHRAGPGQRGGKTAMCSGEGGILDESLESACKYIFGYVPNLYSVSDEYLQRVDATEMKMGQSVKPGLGGHLPGSKVTSEIAAVRGFPEGVDIISPSHFADIRDKHQLKDRVAWLREKSGGRPIGIKIAAGHIEADLEVALFSNPILSP